MGEGSLCSCGACAWGSGPPQALPLLWCVQALVDAPSQARRVVNFKRLALTDYKIELPRLAPKKVVVAKFAEAGACSAGHHMRAAFLSRRPRNACGICRAASGDVQPPQKACSGNAWRCLDLT